jgi:Flp pilus assembly protein TadG
MGACRGQALVELALVLPVILVMLLGMSDLGRAFVFGVAVQQGAREGARIASNAALDPSVTDSAVLQQLIVASAPAIGGCAAVVDAQQTCGGGTWIFNIHVTPASGAPTYSSLASARSGLASLSGSHVEVRAYGSVALFAGVLSGAQITVQGDAVMVIT